MKVDIYNTDKKYNIYNEDCLKQLDELEENSIDSIVTDPPYGLTSITKRFGKESSAPAQYGKDGAFSRLSKGFMGKEWDGSGIEYNVELWQKCLRVLKPGGYLLAFGGSRTFHRIACSIEDAGFEIRDTIMWLYGSGFPKSLNIGLAIDKKNGIESKVIGKSKSGSTSKAFNLNEQQRKAGTGILAGEYDLKEAQNEWNGWGTALKPSFEPIIIARKPFKGSLVDNVIKWGVGGLNIDECRVGLNGDKKTSGGCKTRFDNISHLKFRAGQINKEDNSVGRFPANTILTYDETDFDEVCGGFPNTKGNGNIRKNNNDGKNYNCYSNYGNCETRGYEDSGSASRYFYCAKASKKDRDEGLDEFETKGAKELLGREENSDGASWNGKYSSGNAFAGSGAPKKNTHPTVKPTELMKYLVRLVTPKGGTILDPFMGSGSTGKAVMFENKERQANYKFIGIEKEKEYCDIAEARIEFVNKE